jgi:hypothetical protein
MGTRADFYVGRGANAEWIGSIAWDGHPCSIDEAVLRSSSQEEFRSTVASFFTPRRDATIPEQGWPWPWKDSHLTDYVYAFDGKEVLASNFGNVWFPAREPEPPWPEEEERAVCPICGHDYDPSVIYPSMADRQNEVTIGKRSGLMVIGFDSQGRIRPIEDGT